MCRRGLREATRWSGYCALRYELPPVELGFLPMPSGWQGRARGNQLIHSENNDTSHARPCQTHVGETSYCTGANSRFDTPSLMLLSIVLCIPIETPSAAGAKILSSLRAFACIAA